MAWICVENHCGRHYFDERSVVSVEESIDWKNHKKPCGWPDGFGAKLTVAGIGGALEQILIWDEDWPALKAQLRLSECLVVTRPADWRERI